MSFHAPIVYTPAPAIVSAWEARGYTPLAVQWHVEAQARQRRMRGLSPKDSPSNVRILIVRDAPVIRLATWITKEVYLHAHEVLDRLDGVSQEPLKKLPRPRLILDVVCEEYNVKPLDVLSGRRDMAAPRQLAMWMNKAMRPDSTPMIGKNLGGKDHTTVLHGIKKIDARINADASFSEFVGNVRRMIEARI